MAGATGWTIKGLDLRTQKFELQSTEGWDSMPSKRGGSVVVSGRHGTVINSHRFYNSRFLRLPVIIRPQGSAGGTTPYEHLQENTDELLGALHSLNELQVVRTMPNGDTRQIAGEAIAEVPITELGGGGGIYRLAIIQVECAYPFWHDTTGGLISDDGNSGSFVVTPGGTAPIGDSVWTFTAAGVLTNTGTGDTLTITAGFTGSLVIDMLTREVTHNGGASQGDQYVEPGQKHWIELQPGANNFTLSAGSCDVDYYPGYL